MVRSPIRLGPRHALDLWPWRHRNSPLGLKWRPPLADLSSKGNSPPCRRYPPPTRPAPSRQPHPEPGFGPAFSLVWPSFLRAVQWRSRCWAISKPELGWNGSSTGWTRSRLFAAPNSIDSKPREKMPRGSPTRNCSRSRHSQQVGTLDACRRANRPRRAMALSLSLACFAGRRSTTSRRGPMAWCTGSTRSRVCPRRGARGLRRAHSRWTGLPWVRDNVVLHKGWFDETLPGFRTAHPAEVSFLHMDADLYSSTRTVLEMLSDRVSARDRDRLRRVHRLPRVAGWRVPRLHRVRRQPRRGVRIHRVGAHGRASRSTCRPQSRSDSRLATPSCRARESGQRRQAGGAHSTTMGTAVIGWGKVRRAAWSQYPPSPGRAWEPGRGVPPGP